MPSVHVLSSLVTFVILLPYMPDLLMASLVQIAGHKMAAFTVMFSRLLISTFNQGDETTSKNLLCA